MDFVEEFRPFVLPPATEDIGVEDPRWGPLDDEAISLLLRRIDFKKIIAFHTKETQHKLQKFENLNKKLKETVSLLQGELQVTKTTCEEQQVKIEGLQKRLEETNNGERLELIEAKLEELQVDEVNLDNDGDTGDDGGDNERLQTMEIKVEELKLEESRHKERLDTIETKIEELVSEDERNLQVPQHQDNFAREVREVEKSIIIKNLPMVSSTEDVKETTTMVKEVFRQINLPSSVKFSAKRIFNTKKDAKPGRNGRKGWPPIINVTFKSSDTKTDLFKQLQHLKGSKYEKLSIQNEYPPCVRKEARSAEMKAAEHRKNNPGAQTKLSLNNGNPIILVKSQSSSKYMPLEE